MITPFQRLRQLGAPQPDRDLPPEQRPQSIMGRQITPVMPPTAPQAQASIVRGDLGQRFPSPPRMPFPRRGEGTWRVPTPVDPQPPGRSSGPASGGVFPQQRMFGGNPGQDWIDSISGPMQDALNPQPAPTPPPAPQPTPAPAANPFALNPIFVQGQRALDDALAAELAANGVSRDQLGAYMNLIEQRLRTNEAEDYRRLDEALNARGVLNSGIRTDDRARTGLGFDRQRQDIASDTASQYAGLARADAAARANYGQGISDLLLKIAGLEATDPDSPFGGGADAYAPPAATPSKKGGKNKKNKGGKNKKGKK